MSRHLRHETGENRPVDPRGSSSRLDWRGWIALAWVVVWGWAYALMAIQARSPQVLGWIRALSRVAFSGDQR